MSIGRLCRGIMEPRIRENKNGVGEPPTPQSFVSVRDKRIRSITRTPPSGEAEKGESTDDSKLGGLGDVQSEIVPVIAENVVDLADPTTEVVEIDCLITIIVAG